MQHMTKINNLSDVIPPMESIPCPDCGNRVTISPHLILMHNILLARKIVSIMANAGTLHAKIV